MRVWIDTDIGSDVDDALALAYVLRHPGLELAGVSTVFGDTALRSRIARALLDRVELRVPVVTGLGAPRTPGRDGLLFGHEGAGLLPNASPRIRTTHDPDPGGAVDRIADALEATRPEALLAIGPLSNLAALVDADVTLPPLTIMGGHFGEGPMPGLVDGRYEWNWYCDPDAARRVLEAPHAVAPRILPAEITFRTRLEEGDVERLERAHPLGETLAELCREWLRAQVERLGARTGRIALHDPLAAATLVRDDLCRFSPLRTGLDEAACPTGDEGPVHLEVARDVDPARVREHLLATWC